MQRLIIGLGRSKPALASVFKVSGVESRNGNLLLALARLVALGLALWGVSASRNFAGTNTVLGAPAPSASFQEFLQTLWPFAQQKGIMRATFDSAFAGLELDPALVTASNRQAEFDKPLKVYLNEAVSTRRIERGRECLRRWQGELATIEQRFGVPTAIVIAAYGMETDFGSAAGEKDVIRSLATLAYSRPDRPVFHDELVDALVILDHGGIARAAMKGSWAGAMGGPQFLPSAFLKYAVNHAGKGAPDIWNDPLDSLASIANFLRQSGWRPGLPWGMEVILPKNFSFASLHQSFDAFAAQSVKSANAGTLPHGEATLFLPSGARGPAFLLSSNYWILKAYNNSDSYALSLGLLAERINGEPALQGRWPEGEIFLSQTQKAEIQRLLEKLGFYQGQIDGRFGQASRDAIHEFQIRSGKSPADGFATPELLDRLAAEADHRPVQ
ncbi:MAG TPA: lytic murein transglycosylase [Methylocella sp.]|nr:lytic murein transglycosylase [Methylocella sp.]